jgi:hypothetical protein
MESRWPCGSIPDPQGPLLGCAPLSTHSIRHSHTRSAWWITATPNTAIISFRALAHARTSAFRPRHFHCHPSSRDSQYLFDKSRNTGDAKRYLVADTE